ncbi:MAG: ubiquinol-cytochrome c reductase iron-sulfur subunit [Bryobacteraceae bacterium]
MAQQEGTAAEGTRRRFHVTVIYALTSLISAGFGIPALLYLILPSRRQNNAQFVEIGDVAQLRTDQPEEIVFRRTRQDGWRRISEKTSAWVLRLDGGQVVAFAPGCTHLGCAYHWDERNKNFLCPCHTSTFAADGRVLEGPAPRPLDRYQTRVENGKLQVGPVIQVGKEA